MSTYQVEPDEPRAAEADVGTLAGADGGDATTFDAPEEG